MEPWSKDQSEQPDLQMQDQVKTDDQSKVQQPSLKMTCGDVKVSKEQQTGQLMKEVRPPFPSLSARPKHPDWVLFCFSTAGTNTEGIVSPAAAEQESAGRTSTREEESAPGTSMTLQAVWQNNLRHSLLLFCRTMVQIKTKSRFYGSRGSTMTSVQSWRC